METKANSPIVGYINRKEPLALSEQLNFPLELTYTLEEFINRMMKDDCSGLILDIHKVMSEHPQERNRIFAIASGYPIVRTRMDKYGNRIFIDNPQVLKKENEWDAKVNVREEERVETDIQASISYENDPAMADSISVKLKNISLEGCFITTTEDFSEEQFINIRIETLSNKLPIVAGIRWYTNKTHTHQGFGVKFIKILEEQREEIEKLYFT
ncbi:PilZ domain-containing protein [Maridesulfovibrio bastinii]|uniref:PilZ domain-containing protein n=1 Tax=Maridesulfovibrio bastinii TaxID=47157 RepID=UPI000419C736|nr:PilZ domain-containing protein [Maridesulfovibrio bastinii]